MIDLDMAAEGGGARGAILSPSSDNQGLKILIDFLAAEEGGGEEWDQQSFCVTGR